jgi:1-acyl-sn-glycerol-3-phosphate acyltransferase
MQGYYRNPEATQAVYKEGWWDSGDLGYIGEGELYITGRKKDVIIKAGRNLYPAEVEEITSQIPGVRKGCVVAFGVTDTERGTEKFIVVAETREQKSTERNRIITETIEKINAVLGLPPDKVVLVAPHTIPKTSSGKLRRSSSMKMYLAGKLEKPGLPAWVQIAKLFVIGQTRKLTEIVTSASKTLFTGYGGLVFLITLLPVWILINVVSRPSAARILQIWAKIILTLTFCPIKVIGKENLPEQKPVIYVSNHASYLDVIALISFMPTDIIFIGKQELEKNVLLRTVIKRLGYISVNRLDFTQSLTDAENIQQALQEGRSIVLFPEGTFTYATGLRPFKLGAFKLAVETNTPISPIALRGTRNILRGDSRLLRPGKITATIGKSISPKSKEWNEVIRLRNLARAEIAKHCGEPSIDLVRAGYEGE